jgi:Xaa-Pro dipeptidase
MEEIVPQLLHDGISEAEFAADLYSAMVAEGHHGITRFAMFDNEMLFGQIGFGENSVYPTNFNGPGGSRGLGPAVPLLGSRERRLKKGDLVFVDVGCGYGGYHTDKTVIYVYKGELPPHAAEAHRKCVGIQGRVASMLRPGITPAEIYDEIMGSLEPGFARDFMGFGNHKVKFLGHGIGLNVDETPVIAANYKEPLREGIVFAVEPKKGIAGVGMVGVENTFLVTRNGGVSMTGTMFDPIEVR